MEGEGSFIVGLLFGLDQPIENCIKCFMNDEKIIYIISLNSCIIHITNKDISYNNSKILNTQMVLPHSLKWIK